MLGKNWLLQVPSSLTIVNADQVAPPSAYEAT